MKILLDSGSGGRASQRLIADVFLRHFDNGILRRMDDAALLDLNGPVAMSTDGYTVTPLFFPGGSIGSLAVHGTVNDVSMMGARPRYLSCAFILEEGLDTDVLERVVSDMARAAEKAGVSIVTGDTKVVPKGACDGLFITTAGVGEVIASPAPSGHSARPGDAVLVSGAMGDHGLTVMARRDNLTFAADVASDSAPLNRMVERLITEVGDIHVLPPRSTRLPSSPAWALRWKRVPCRCTRACAQAATCSDSIPCTLPMRASLSAFFPVKRRRLRFRS